MIIVMENKQWYTIGMFETLMCTQITRHLLYIYIYHVMNPPACRRVLWILLVRSCTVCLVFCLCLDFPLARIFAPSNLNPPPPPPPSPNFNPNPAYATQSFLSSLRIFPLCLSLQCAGFVSAPALHTVRVFLFAPLRPALHVLGWLAGLLLSKLSSAAVASPWMCYKGFLGLTPRLHNSLGLAKSFAALKTHSCTDQPCLTQVPCPASSPSCSCWVGCFATLSLLTALKSRVGSHLFRV